MGVQKPSIPKGTRDFSSEEMAARNYIFDTIRAVFKTYGYSQIETPAMENLSTLLGKYGDEGDKLLFRILNSGDAFAGIESGDFIREDGSIDSGKLTQEICEKGLRYDLTVPFARFVVQHQNELTFPFKRFQIQPVWRADRPQKGRYREFYQCDADVIGSRSQLGELELVEIVDDVFSAFGISVTIKINNRKILTGLAEVSGCPDKVIDITVAIDKIDKIGIEAVEKEMQEKGIIGKSIEVIREVLTMEGDTSGKLESMRRLMNGESATGIVSDTGLKGLDEMEELFGYIALSGISQTVEMDLSLARGLNYYTGAIFEVKANDFAIGSICGGGRYDNLTGIFGLQGMSGVGISFGADRIFDVLKGLGKFPTDLARPSDVLFANMDADSVKYTVQAVRALRKAGISCEIYPDSAKLKKQFEFAQKKQIPFISINGSEEAAKGTINLKNLSSGEQKSFANDALDAIRSFLSR